MIRYVQEADVLAEALKASRRKITIFVSSIAALVVVFGSLIYLIEGPENGFTSIPKSIYWAVITMTTVGYGDLVPKTAVGQTMATVIMLVGYGIIAVPTGIVTIELDRANRRRPTSGIHCPGCSSAGHVADARYCWSCGRPLPKLQAVSRSRPAPSDT